MDVAWFNKTGSMKGYERPNDQHRQKSPPKAPVNCGEMERKLLRGFPRVLAAKSRFSAGKVGRDTPCDVPGCQTTYSSEMMILQVILLQGTTVRTY